MLFLFALLAICLSDAVRLESSGEAKIAGAVDAVIMLVCASFFAPLMGSLKKDLAAIRLSLAHAQWGLLCGW